MVNAVRFSIIKVRISINFMHLRPKLTSEICQKVGSLDGKTKQKHPKSPTLPTFSQKNLYIFSETINAYRLFIVIINIFHKKIKNK